MTTRKTTRRAVLAGAAAAIPATVASAVGNPISEDSRVFAILGQRWRDAIRALEAFRDEEDICDQVEARVPVPEALSARAGDLEFGFDPPRGGAHITWRRATSISLGRGGQAALLERTNEFEDRVTEIFWGGADWSPDKQARASAVIAAYDQLLSERGVMKAELGAEQAEEARNELLDCVNEIEEEIADAPVRTVEEAVCKARLVNEVLQHLSRGSSDDPEILMALRLVADVASLATAQS